MFKSMPPDYYLKPSPTKKTKKKEKVYKI